MNRILNYLRDAIGGVLFYFGQTKLRTALTLLGITVGVSSIIAIMTVLTTFEKTANGLVSEMKTNLFYITKDNPIEISFGGDGRGSRNKPPITWSEYEQLKRSLTLTTSMAAAVAEEPSDRTISVGKNELKNRLSSFWGSDGDMLSINQYEIVEGGRNLFKTDMDNSSRVAIIGSDVKDELFPYSDPVGQTIKIDNIPFEVIALTEPKGEMLGQSMDAMIGIPISTYLKYFGSRGHKRTDLLLMLESESIETLDAATDEAVGVFRAIRKIPPGEDNNFYIATNDQLMDTFGEFTGYITIFIGLIAGISLLVAGIGIANIMLVSLTERIKEIGIRKALGARKVDIFLQFLIEAILISIIGGIVGIILGLSFGNIVALFLEQDPVIPFDWVFYSIQICASMGIIFGLYPAIKASNLNPIDSMRYE
ncbi:MAG: ABC transporter permease [Candidatus Marinimicrobia bacterium]|jgi:putative ABC transport system permease protein|nr:ABC transporter permease [Candidatus Neomarinimicrobiota bacterium]